MTLSEERSCAEALMMACDERLGAQSPAALMVCDTFLARDFWTSFVHQSYLPPVASQVWACGSNEHGQLGLFDRQKHFPVPTEVTALHGRRIHAVACGMNFTMAVVDDGELWGTGDNVLGQLGLGDCGERIRFIRISGLTGKVAAVACGNAHTLALLDSGELFAWGCNNYGQLGLGDSENTSDPEPVAALSSRRVAAIACGSVFSFAVLETGDLFAWGCNNHGQLGIGHDGESNLPKQVLPLSRRRIKTVSGGLHHAAAVMESGELFTWGWNEFGQLGSSVRDDRNAPQLVEALRNRSAISVACGVFHTVALLKAGEVFTWGWNDIGQLGTGKKEAAFFLPQQVPFFRHKPARSIVCGHFFSGAVLEETGVLFVWGHNISGQLGQGTKSRGISKPVPVPVKHAVLCAAQGLGHCIITSAADVV